MEADFACLADLLAVPGWKYAVNLAGSETMLATNRSLPIVLTSHLRELVMELRSAPMSTIFAVSRLMPESEQWRFQNKFLPLSFPKGYDPENQCNNLITMCCFAVPTAPHPFTFPLQFISSANVEFTLKEKKGEAEPVPFKLAIFKGIKSHRLPRGWVRWLLSHPVPQTFASWAATSALPDEMLVPTLARVSQGLQQEDGRWLVEQKGDLRDPRHLQHWAPDMSCRGGSTI